MHGYLADLAAKRVVQDGIITLDEQGIERKHPALQIHRDNSAAFLKYAAEFGLSPSSRTRLAVKDPSPKGSAWEGFPVPAVSGRR